MSKLRLPCQAIRLPHAIGVVVAMAVALAATAAMADSVIDLRMNRFSSPLLIWSTVPYAGTGRQHERRRPRPIGG
jgi:hypothetical protein